MTARCGGVTASAVVLCSMLLAPPAGAQEYAVDTLGLRDGVPSPYVTAVDEDFAGRVWIATRVGLAHFYGFEWFYLEGSPNGLGLLFWPADGAPAEERPWAIDLRHPITLHQPIPSGWRAHRQQSFEGDVSSLAAAQPDTAAPPVFLLGTPEGLLYWEAGWRWLWPGEGGVPAGPIRAVARHAGSWWLGTEQGLFQLDGRPGEVLAERPPETPAEAVYGLAPTLDGRSLWVVGEGWIGRLEESGELIREPTPVPPVGTVQGRFVARADASGGLFYGHREALWRFQPGRGAQPLSRANGLLAAGANALHRDHLGTMWVASNDGLSRLVSLRFANYRREHGLLADEVTAIHPLARGPIVLGHLNGLTLLDPETLEVLRRVSLPAGAPSRVWAMSEDPEGRLWIAADSRVLVLDPGGELRPGIEPEQLAGQIEGIAADAAGVVWIGTSEGLFRHQGGVTAAVDLPATADGRRLMAAAEGQPTPRLPGEPRGVRRLELDRDGRGLWIAMAQAGLLQYRDGVFEVFQNPAVPRANWIWDILERADGEVWVATLAGLHRARDGGLEPLVRPGLDVPHVPFFVSEDPRGQVWVGTSRGVILWDGARSRSFSVLNGLAGQEINRAGFYAGADGAVWIGTDKGLSLYRPELDREPPAPRLALLALEAGARSYSLAETVRLDNRPDALAFSFRALTASAKSPLLVRTRLEGLEDSWSAPHAVRTRAIRYAGLPSGSYRLHLMARERGGRWSEPVASPPIVVARPMWQRGWFLGLGAVLAFGLLWWGQSSIAQRRYARRLEGQLAHRWRELEASEERYRRVVTAIGDGVITVDGEARITMLNPAAERIVGHTEADAIGRPFDEILPLETSVDGVTGPVTGLLGGRRAGVVNATAARLRTSAGEERDLELVAAPMLGAGGGSAGAVLAFQDVTEKRRQEEQQARVERLESLGLLAGGIAHDFNNLLTAVGGNLELLRLRGGELEPHTLAEAERAVLRARGLTQQLLTFSRGGAPIRRATSIAEVIEEAAQLTLSGSKLGRELEFAPGLYAVDIDPIQMHQVFSNIFLNAVEAMPEGGKVWVTAENVASSEGGDGESLVRVTVRDDGPGIPRKIRERIFDPYFSTKDRGTGLGLSSAFSIVRRHGGSLEVESRVGEGTTFRIDLPVAAAVETAPAVSVEHAPAHGNGAQRILVMDDEAAVRRVTGRILERHGYRVVTVGDGAQAIEQYRRAHAAGETFDAVITDLTVPGGMGGREALDQLRALDPEVRAIVASGYANDPVMADYREHGFRAVLTKPFLADDLLRILREVLG